MNKQGGIGSILKNLRKQNGLTQKQVADILNMDRSTYTYYETGKTQPNISSLKKLATIYNTDVDSVVGFTVPSRTVLSEPHEEYKTKSISLSNDEKVLLLNFRLISDKEKQRILDDVQKTAENTEY